jgi:hypothetical protein
MASGSCVLLQLRSFAASWLPVGLSFVTYAAAAIAATMRVGKRPLPFRFQVSKSEAPKLRGLVASQLVYEQPIPTRRTVLIVGRSVSVN